MSDKYKLNLLIYILEMQFGPKIKSAALLPSIQLIRVRAMHLKEMSARALPLVLESNRIHLWFEPKKGVIKL